jgi:hypothetical protein
MSRWYRVFGSLDTPSTPAGIGSCLAGEGVSIVFDAEDWHTAELAPGSEPPLVLERWRSDEEGIRAELNTWAAYLETCDGPHHVALMERTIQTKQLFTIGPSNGAPLDRVCVTLCRHLAAVTAGFYQIDDIGFFDADGTLLVEG